jgi:hypothetical protein
MPMRRFRMNFARQNSFYEILTAQHLAAKPA